MYEKELSMYGYGSANYVIKLYHVAITSVM